MKIFWSAIFCLPFIILGAGKNPDPLEIIRKADEKNRGKSSYSMMKIKTVRPDWTREMELKAWSLGTEYSLVYLVSPAKEKGTVFLKRDQEMWNWIPRIDRSIKMPPSMMMQSWMGTDFTNDDLVKQSSIVTDYTHKYTGDSTIENRSCWKIELTPKPEAAVVWGSIVAFVDQADYLQLRVEYYDEEGELVNILRGLHIKKMGDRLLPSVLEYIPVEKPGHKTVIEYKHLEFGLNLEKSFFSTRNMKKAR